MANKPYHATGSMADVPSSKATPDQGGTGKPEVYSGPKCDWKPRGEKECGKGDQGEKIWAVDIKRFGNKPTKVCDDHVKPTWRKFDVDNMYDARKPKP